MVIAVSMAVNWAAVANAFPAGTAIQTSGATNPGLSPSTYYSPILQPQPVISTLFQEYPTIEPSYQNQLDRIVFMTTFGQYSFSKAQPFMSFTYRDGTLLLSHSMFYVNSTFPRPVTFSGYSIDMSTLNSHHFAYSVNLQTGGLRVGSLRVDFSFDRVQRPKISIQVTPSAALTAHGFNVIWIVRGLSTVARFREGPAGTDFGNYTTVTQVAYNETHFEMASTRRPERWHVSALVDWSDARVKAKIGFGAFPLFSFLSGPVAAVTFPANLTSIDPTVVGQSSAAYGSAQSFQRHSFFDGTNYWVFFYNGSATIYTYSSDSRTWNNPVGVLWPYPYTAIWYNSGNIYALAGTSSSGSPSANVTLLFRKGTIGGQSIAWGAKATVDAYTYTDTGATTVWADYQDANLVVGSDGLVTVMYTLFTESGYYEYEPPPPGCSQYAIAHSSTTPMGSGGCRYRWVWSYSGSRALLVKKSVNADGTVWTPSTTIISDASYLNHYLPSLSPLANGVVLAVYEDNANGGIKYSLSTAWTTVSQLDTGPSGTLQFGSAVSNSAYSVNLVYVYSDNTIRYRSYNGNWSTPATIAPATSMSPTVSLGYGNDLNVLYVNSNILYLVQYSSFSGWGAPTTPLGTTFNSPAYLSSGSNSTSGFLVSLWTEGTAAPYAIKLSSLPIQQVWSPYTVPSDPWDQEGLIPYGHYFKNLEEYASPYSGLLSVVQDDFALPGRGFTDTVPLTFTRTFRTPYTFQGSTPYGYENYPYANLGLGWSLDWPWMGTNYLHLGNGQGYKIAFVNNVFENHQGEQFKFLRNANGTYTLYDKSADIYQFNSAKQLVSILDRTHNNQVTFTYDTSNRISVIADTVGRTISLSYDPNSRLSTVNTGGRIWTYGYNSNGNLVSVQDPLGRISSYEYTSTFSPSLLTKIKYPTGAYTTYTYIQAPIGTETQTYRASQQTVYLPSATVVRQTSFSYTVGSADRVLSSTLTFTDGTSTQGYVNYAFTPTNATTTTENAQAQAINKTVDQYNANGQISQQTVFLGGSSTSYTDYYNFDNWGNLIYRRLAINQNSYRETFYSYANTNTQYRFVDISGINVTSFSNSFYANTLDPNMHARLLGRAEFQNGAGSNKTEAYYEYDGVGDLLQRKDLLGSTWLTTNFSYDTYGNVLTLTDAQGHQTTYQYSPTYQYAYVTQSSNLVSGLTLATQYAYNFTTGDRITVTSPSGNMTDYRYDSIGRPTSITSPSIGGVRAQRRMVYDDVNNIATVYDENNNYAKYYYDGLARPTQTQTYANGAVYSTAASTYYWNDQLKTYTDPTGNVTTYSYDFLRRILTLTHPDGTFKQWSYNDVASQVTANDEKGHPTDYYHDWLNRLVTVSEHVSGQNYNTNYAYDAVGNVLQIQDSKNQITSYAYDNLNRMVRIIFPDTTSESRAYDNVGNLVSRTTQNNTILLYSYDEINRLTKITYPDGSTVTYTYDKDSNRLQMVDAASTTTYTYDPRGRLLSETRIINGQPYPLTYQYDPASNLIQLTYPDGYVLSYTYDALNRITAVGSAATITYRKNSEISQVTYGNGVQTAYSYDQLGRVTRIHTWNSTVTLLDLNYAYDSNGNPTSVNSGQETYGYDELNRLSSANGPFGTITYSYDQVGNRLSEVVNGTGTTYSYGNYNKLLSAGSTTYTYDNNGNMISKTAGANTWSYTYDYENRLKQAALNGLTAFQAMYDGDGRRIETVAGDTTVYHYLAGSWNPSYVKDLTSGVVTDVVIAGGFRVGKVQAGVNYYYHLDRLGSVRLVTQSANVQSFVGKYLPYGASYATSGAENFQYTGKQLDITTGLYYYGYRYLEGQSGRFVSADIQQPNYVNPQSINRYPYALNNPNRYVDRDGRQPEMGAIEFGAGLGALFGPEGILIGALVGLAVALAYDYVSQPHPPQSTELPPGSHPSSYADWQPPSGQGALYKAAAMNYAETLKKRADALENAIEKGTDLVVKAIERMLERKAADFGFSGPPTKVPGGWI
jgi:RHS repeat-associated protein